MGLDMWVIKFEKVPEDSLSYFLGKKTSDISNEFMCISKEEFDENVDMYSDLIPLVTQVEMIETKFNEKRFCEDYNVDKSNICGSHCGMGVVGWYLTDNRHIQMDQKQYEEYLYEENVEMYVLKREKVGYWRGQYELNDLLESIRIQSRTLDFLSQYERPPTDLDISFWRTANCGYYELSNREKDALAKLILSNSDDYNQELINLLHDNKLNLFYHAWW